MDPLENEPNSPIGNVPVEIFLTIFLSLDVKCLKNLALTCSWFRDIITENVLVTRKMKLKLAKDFWQSHQELPHFGRRYETIEIYDVENSHSMLVDLSVRFGNCLRILTIEKSTLDEFTLFTILSSCECLEELWMSEVEIRRNLEEIREIILTKLRSVTIRYTSWRVFRYLVGAQISSLEIDSYVDEGRGTRHHLVQMLSKQNQLTTLALYGTACRTLFRNSDVNWRSRLTSFHIKYYFGKNSNNVDENIVQFLLLNSQTLTNVEISLPNSRRVAACTVLNLGNVTSLTLQINGLQRYEDFYVQLANEVPNRKLKHLNLSAHSSHSRFIKSILKRYPTVTDLELRIVENTNVVQNMLPFLSDRFPHVEQLFVPETSNVVLTFPALKKLHLSYFKDVNNLVKFIGKNKSIEIVIVDFVHVQQMSSIDKLIYDTRIPHLSLAGCSQSLQKIIDLVQSKQPEQMQTLELRLLAHESHEAFKIHFPCDLNDLKVKFLRFFGADL
ncbi:hypothetical protein Bhyg_15802 [Pseudolycoriella hygida]|uniref:F-box domain-containing protein n=1 Tax=Pseudolycoriella hygida TaxID=35572 RepID=A0A9Q0MMK8_9DIPT|nr:hypothetical protein Bhyg_15802 [Pseudolycoriella hygida]